MERHKLTREFEHGIMKLIMEHGTNAARASGSLEMHGTALRKWGKDFSTLQPSLLQPL